MLCLDMKLVSRLRGTASSGTNTSSTQPSTVLPSLNSTDKSKSRKARRDSGEVPIITSDSEEELLRPGSSVQEMIRRNRSRSVCVAILPSSQLRHLHRRASHVYVASDLTRLTMKSIAESTSELLTLQLSIIRFLHEEQVTRYYRSSFCLSYGYSYLANYSLIRFLLFLSRRMHENLLFYLMLDLLIDLSLFFFCAITR